MILTQNKKKAIPCPESMSSSHFFNYKPVQWFTSLLLPPNICIPRILHGLTFYINSKHLFSNYLSKIIWCIGLVLSYYIYKIYFFEIIFYNLNALCRVWVPILQVSRKQRKKLRKWLRRSMIYVVCFPFSCLLTNL